MTNLETELQEMLGVARFMGHGYLYLLLYYGQLAITNQTGMMNWPEGPKVVVAMITRNECFCGLSKPRKAFILEKLHSLNELSKEKNRKAG